MTAVGSDEAASRGPGSAVTADPHETSPTGPAEPRHVRHTRFVVDAEGRLSTSSGRSVPAVRTLPVRDPVGDPASGVGNWNLANALTTVRLLLVPVFVALLFRGSGHESLWRVAAWATFAVAALTDHFDGRIARARGLVTDFGKIADPIADKALTGAAMVGLSILGDLPWWITGVVLARELGVTLLRFWVLHAGVLPASRGGKLKTLLLGIAIGLYVLPLGGVLATARFGIMLAAIVVALLTAVDYVGRATRLRREAARAR